MSDYWNDKGLYCVENCKDKGMPITAMYMKEIVQQRAELLEALKDMRNGWRYIRETHGDLYGVGWDRAENKANAAITNTEATK